MLLQSVAAQVGDRFGWPGFWLIVLIAAGVLATVVYLWFLSRPPSGPKVGE